jgi:CAAX prenyl protease-like protein
VAFRLPGTSWVEEHPSAQYTAPFILFVILLAVFARFPADPRWEAPFRVTLLAIVCFACWPRELPLRPSYPLVSTLIGAGVFLLWIAPDTVFPHYREHVLFSNSIVGRPHSSIPATALQSGWVLAWRTARAVVIVPIVEELFWRGWLMRWIINSDFRRVPLGAYSPLAFWLTAVLFASEHGSYWDVGLLTGVIYNLWMIRSKSIADCILMHAVTNAALSEYVIAAGQWQYWQ